MKVIIPLAGPDFIQVDGKPKSELLIDGQPLLRRALESRPWWRDGSISDKDFIFVLHDDDYSRDFVRFKLLTWYPGASYVLISQYTQGAALSALAGCAVLPDLNDFVCFDLADIIFDSNLNIFSAFSDKNVGSVVLSFESVSPLYSYFRRDASGVIVEAAEKVVISSEASAGVYFFRSASVYLSALAHMLSCGRQFTYNERFFICPSVNGVLNAGLNVSAVAVDNVLDVKMIETL